MRFSMTRHIASLLGGPKRLSVENRELRVSVSEEWSASEEVSVSGKAVTIAPEFDPLDYASFLLSIDAELEHSLMVQYLYGAYSLGGPQVPPKHRDMVRGWQDIVLGIAKEEMGHLITIQNVLRLIGAPLDFGREDYPWDTPFLPYPFMLEPLTLEALAKYIFAESPADWSGPLADEIAARLPATAPRPHKVSELFAQMIELVSNPAYLPDDVFQADTWPFQAKWSEWGRGYAGGERGDSSGANPRGTPNVFVEAVASRDDAVNALKKVAEQGEACEDSDIGAPSHFARFVKVYEEMKTLLPVAKQEGWLPWRAVATNPFIPTGEAALPVGEDDCPDAELIRRALQEPITHPEAVAWGHLFNVRYRMILNYLTHSFELAGGLSDAGISTPRGTIISATFGEMYNMRAIAGIMVQLPLSAVGDQSSTMAGPPFQMPYTLKRPMGDANRWRQHQNVLRAAELLIEELLEICSVSHRRYLYSLREADQELLRTIGRFLAGQTSLTVK